MRTNLDKIKWNNCDSFLLLLIKLESYADKIGLNKKWRKKTVRFLGGFKYCLMHQDVFCPIPDSLWNAIMQTQIERVGANFIKRKSLLWRCCRWYRRIFTHLHNELRDVQSCSKTVGRDQSMQTKLLYFWSLASLLKFKAKHSAFKGCGGGSQNDPLVRRMSVISHMVMLVYDRNHLFWLRPDTETETQNFSVTFGRYPN